MTDRIQVGRPRLERDGRTTRVVADVDGEPLWFASDDLDLVPRAEGFASAVLPAALETHRVLESAAGLPQCWRAGAAEIATIGAEWWGWGAADIDAPRRRELPRRVQRLRPGRRTALTFSGGVDSFHALLAGGVPIDILVSVHGFDIPLDDTDRMAAWERSLRAVAAARGLACGVVRTNVRTHPIASLVSWPRAHGGALAALGHLLGGGVDRLVVASSYPRVLDLPWGSHWRLDHLWSTERLEVGQVGEAYWRSDKLGDVGDHDLVRRHLRVCWENRTHDLNCGRCEKCVRTQLVLLSRGQLAAMQVFPPELPLDRMVDEVPAFETEGLVLVYTRLAEQLPPEIAAAVRRLVDRSYPAPDPR
jgi:hypothetical protein